MNHKVEYVIKTRLSPKSEFVLMQVKGRHATFEAARERVAWWYESTEDLLKAKPEAIIETEVLPHLTDCRKCGHALFKNDIVYYLFGDRYCYDCSIEGKFKEGYYDLLGEYEAEQIRALHVKDAI